MAFVYKTTKLTLDLLLKMVRADVRLHNADVVRDDMAIVFVANHFTRLETLLLPYYILKHTGREPWSLAAQDLFQGGMANVMKGVGAISTKDPDRDKIIIRELLTGEHPWIIFPEGAMIKDKKLVNEAGEFEIYHRGERRAPFRGAAVLALQAEFYRRVISELRGFEGPCGPEKALNRFDLPEVGTIPEKRTFIVPVNITYFPIRLGENFVLNLAQRFNEKLSDRAVEELSMEGALLGRECDIDITLGEPIDVSTYMDGPEFERALGEAVACEGIGEGEAEKPDREDDDAERSIFASAANSLMLRYMADIYKLTRLNFDHVFATIIRHQGTQVFTERAYRNRIFLSIHEILERGGRQVHGLLASRYREIIYEEPSDKYENFLKLCLDEKVLIREGNRYRRNLALQPGRTDFHSVRQEELSYVIANEIEPLTDVTETIRKYAEMPRPELSRRIRKMFVEDDQRIFEEDYAKYFEEGVSKPKDIGRPFLLLPPRKVRTGVVLVHGYLAAPMEVRAFAESLRARGCAVYGVRLRGHGTSPRNLGEVRWEEWYESLNRGYTAIKSLTDDIVLGGFSTGGCLALLAAARKGTNIRSVFAVNAPLHLRNYAVHLLQPAHTVNSLLSRIRGKKPEWEFVDSNPENPHINYDRNPIAGVKQLNECIREMERSLGDVKTPTLLIQASEDHVVDPVSAQLLFAKVGAAAKELTYMPRDRHGIVNGPGSEDVFERVHEFLIWSKRKRREMEIAAEARVPEEAAETGGVPEPEAQPAG